MHFLDFSWSNFSYFCKNTNIHLPQLMLVHTKVASVAATPCKQTTAVADCTERNMVWSQFRLLSLSNLKSSHATIHLCHPTHTRDATSLLTTAGEHLTGACLWESVFCVVSHYAFHDNIKGLIDLISLLAFLKLFCLCCLQSDEEPNAGFLSAYLLLYECARVRVRQRDILTSSYHLIAHSSAASFCLFCTFHYL